MLIQRGHRVHTGNVKRLAERSMNSGQEYYISYIVQSEIRCICTVDADTERLYSSYIVQFGMWCIRTVHNRKCNVTVQHGCVLEHVDSRLSKGIVSQDKSATMDIQRRTRQGESSGELCQED
jgi:hypothetical protein